MPESEHWKRYVLDAEAASDRFAALDHFAADHPGDPVSPLVQALFPEIWRMPDPLVFPDGAPELWREDRKPGEIPPDFIKRVYAPWLRQGFNRAHLRALDPSLSRSLDHWLTKNPMPPDLDLPTLKERNDRALAALGTPEGGFAAREAMRLQEAARRRK